MQTPAANVPYKSCCFDNCNCIMELLIEEVRKNPGLYDKKHKFYLDKVNKEATWKAISKKLGVDAKRKWSYIRDKYRREKKKIESAEDYKPWPFMENLNFLDDVKKRKHENVKLYEKDLVGDCVEELDVYDEIYGSDDTIETTKDDVLRSSLTPQQVESGRSSISSSHRQTMHGRNSSVDLMLIQSLNELSKKIDDEKDEDWHFLQSIKFKMRKMPKKSKRNFKIKMLIKADEAAIGE